MVPQKKGNVPESPSPNTSLIDVEGGLHGGNEIFVSAYPLMGIWPLSCHPLDVMLQCSWQWLPLLDQCWDHPWLDHWLDHCGSVCFDSAPQVAVMLHSQRYASLQ